MARLNEVAAPASFTEQLTAESFEAVKRSLTRQNRQIARSHSAQSLQIRTLNTQISTLLASNTALREENIRLRKELDVARSHAASDHLKTIQEALGAQLKSMAGLLASIDDHTVTIPAAQPSPETRKNICLESMHFRDRPSLREVMDELQMPTIQEMSTTLEAESMARISDVSINSADLGPPPVARMDIVELGTGEEMVSSATENDLAIVHASINIEARRKRKDSISGQARRRSTMVTPMLSPACSPISVKVGEKRKMTDREGETHAMNDENDDFQFTRRNSSLATDQLPMKPNAVRQVLAAKSTNISPKKQRVHEDESKPHKIEVGHGEEKSKRRKSARPVARLPVTIAADVLEPLEHTNRRRQSTRQSGIPIFQPSGVIDGIAEPQPLQNNTASESPVVAPVVLCTETDASLSVDTARTTEDSRPSRRARTAVNYAEPSLVAKMRRPGKEMLDALSGLQDPRNVMSTTSKRPSKASAASESRAHNQRSPIVRRVEDNNEDDLLSPIDDPAVQTTLSLAALIDNDKTDAGISAIDNALDVYDFDDSSPLQSPEISRNTKQVRRHSAILKTTLPDMKTAAKGPSIMATKAAIRRKSMMV